MSYGTSSYGSASLGGLPAAQWFLFLPYQIRAEGTYEATLEFLGTDPLFSLFLRKSNEASDVTIEAFSYNDPDETPQSQGTFSGHRAQHVIGAARFIMVRASIPEGGELIEVRGRVGD